MRGIVFNGEGADVRDDVEVIDPGPDEVLVRLVAAGVCHSDVSLLDGTIPWPAPSLMGHEGAGVVEAVGSLGHPGEGRRPRGDRHRLQLRHLRPVLGRQAHLVPQDARQPARDLHRRRRAGRQLRGHVVVRGDDGGEGGAGGPDRQGGAAHLGVPDRLRRGHRHGLGVQPGQRAAGRQRGGVRRRRRRPLHHPGAAHQGRQPHHRRRHRAVEGRARARSSAPPTSSTRPRPNPVEAIKELLPFSPEMPDGPFGAGGVNWSFECVGHPAVTEQAVHVPRVGRRVRAGRRARAGRHVRRSRSPTSRRSTAASSAAGPAACARSATSR